MLTQEKADSIAKCFALNGFIKKKQTLMDVGYSENYSRALGLKLYDNVVVKEAIAKIKADIEAECKVNAKIQTKRITKQYNKADQNNDIRAALSATDQLNKHIGYYNDEKAPDKPIQGLTINDIKILIQSTQGPELPDNLGIAGSQVGHKLEEK